MISFDLGEKKHVMIEICSKNEQDFTITKANYELIRIGSGEIEDSGDCAITGHVLDALLSPKNACCYILRIMYNIGDQVLIENIEIKVEKYGKCVY